MTEAPSNPSNPSDAACPDAGELLAFLEGRHAVTGEPAARTPADGDCAAPKGPSRASALEEHIALCAVCREVFSALAPSASSAARAVDAFSADLAAGSWATDSPADDEFHPGDPVGRYVVVRRLGSGGMGIVYEAQDPALKRRVAVKVWRGHAPDASDREHMSTLLREEAQAMAQLTHPNVVSVHDVGSVGDRLFITMELVEGKTLEAWLAERRRPWRDVLAVFIPAGHGLAAAHAAGLVHGDFKPSNVLIGRDGRVRVSDFGLSRSVLRDAVPEGAVADAAVAAATVPDGASTRATGVAGTPYYMAPEQRLGHPTDARTDQFSFCIALYSALLGEHPSRAAGNGHGPLSATPRRRAARSEALPGALQSVLARGLSEDPGARYPSMLALLAALETPRGVRLPVLGVALLVALVFSASLLALTTASTPVARVKPVTPLTPPPPSDVPVRESDCTNPAIDVASPRSFLRSCSASALDCGNDGLLHIAASCRRLDGSLASTVFDGRCDPPHRVQNCDGTLMCGVDCRYPGADGVRPPP